MVLLFNERYVAVRKVDIIAAKYIISFNCNTPLTMPVKCVNGLNSLKRFAANVGIAKVIIGIPNIIKSNIIESPIINAMIWFLVKLDVKIPIDTNEPVSNTAPMYCAIIAPISRLPAVNSDIGKPIVKNTPILEKIKPARNFEITMCHPTIG